jgi:hypothetical protein
LQGKKSERRWRLVVRDIFSIVIGEI